MPDASAIFPNKPVSLSVDETMREHKLRSGAIYQTRNHVVIPEGRAFIVYARSFQGTLRRDVSIHKYTSGPYHVSALSGGKIYEVPDWFDALKLAVNL